MVACSVFLRMSLELKVALLTAALVAYLALFHLSPCAQWDCCGPGLRNRTEANATLRWAPPTARRNGGPLCPVSMAFQTEPRWVGTAGTGVCVVLALWA